MYTVPISSVNNDKKTDFEVDYRYKEPTIDRLYSGLYTDYILDNDQTIALILLSLYEINQIFGENFAQRIKTILLNVILLIIQT